MGTAAHQTRKPQRRALRTATVHGLRWMITFVLNRIDVLDLGRRRRLLESQRVDQGSLQGTRQTPRLCRSQFFSFQIWLRLRAPERVSEWVIGRPGVFERNASTPLESSLLRSAGRGRIQVYSRPKVWPSCTDERPHKSPVGVRQISSGATAGTILIVASVAAITFQAADVR